MNLDAITPAMLRARRGAKWSKYPADVLAAWVADMDFPVAEPVREVLAQMVGASDLGYPRGPAPDGLPTVFATRMRERHGWDIDPHRVDVLTDVVQGLHLCIDLFSSPGDAVVTPVPIYPPFLDAVGGNHRRPVWMCWERGPSRYEIDLDRLRAGLAASSATARVMLLCNPHNPTGRVHTRAELEALAALAIEHDLVVVSDEIHSDLVHEPNIHVPIATLGDDIAARTITLASASKAFNIAGLRCAVAHFGSATLQRRFRSLHHHARGGIGTLGMAATAAAWSRGQPWLDEVMAYLRGNRDLVAEHVAARWPDIAFLPPEATYLAWLDFRGRDLAPSPQAFLLARARVALSDGADFGEAGQGYVRLNFATPRPVLVEVLERMDAALQERRSGA